MVLTELLSRPVREFMTSPVSALYRDATLEEAVKLFTEQGISGAPVLSQRGEPAGVISMYDLVAYLAGKETRGGRLLNFYVHSAQRWEAGELDPEDDQLETSVDDVMTQELFTVDVETTLEAAINELSERGIHRLLVLEDGKLTGLLTSMDVIHALAGRSEAKA